MKKRAYAAFLKLTATGDIMTEQATAEKPAAPLTKLTEQQVAEVKAKWEASDKSRAAFRAIQKEYGIRYTRELTSLLGLSEEPEPTPKQKPSGALDDQTRKAGFEADACRARSNEEKQMRISRYEVAGVLAVQAAERWLTSHEISQRSGVPYRTAQAHATCCQDGDIQGKPVARRPSLPGGGELPARHRTARNGPKSWPRLTIIVVMRKRAGIFSPQRDENRSHYERTERRPQNEGEAAAPTVTPPINMGDAKQCTTNHIASRQRRITLLPRHVKTVNMFEPAWLSFVPYLPLA